MYFLGIRFLKIEV